MVLNPGCTLLVWGALGNTCAWDLPQELLVWLVWGTSRHWCFQRFPCASNVRPWQRTTNSDQWCSSVVFGQEHQHQHHLLEMQVLGLTPDIIQSLGWPRNLCFNQSSGWLWHTRVWEPLIDRLLLAQPYQLLSGTYLLLRAIGERGW